MQMSSNVTGATALVVGKKIRQIMEAFTNHEGETTEQFAEFYGKLSN